MTPTFPRSKTTADRKQTPGRTMFQSWLGSLMTAVALISQSQVSTAQTFFSLASSDYSQDFAEITTWTNNYASGVGASNWRTATSVATSFGSNFTVFSTTTSGGVQKGTGTMLFLATGTNAGATDLLLDFGGRKDGVLNLDYAKVANTANNTDPRTSDLKVQYSLDNGATFADTAGYIIPRIANNDTPQSGSLSVTLPPAINNQSQVVLRFYFWNNGQTGGSGSRPKWSIDNLAISSSSLDLPPVLTTAAATAITTGGADLGGNITDTGGATSSERGIFYSSTAGFANGAGTKVSDLAGGFGTGSFTQVVSGLDAGTTYYFKAFATNPNGTGYGPQASFITLPAAPSTPTASAVTSSGFTVNWSAVPGATSYRLDVATNASFTNLVTGYNDLAVATTSKAVTGLDPVTFYHVRVRAVNASGASANSATLTEVTDFTTNPVISLSPSALSGFSVAFAAGPSASQSFTVTGTNLSLLTSDLSVSALGTAYEVSANNVTFGSSASIPYTGNSVVAPAYVRLKAGLAAGNYNNQVIEVAGFGAQIRNVTVSGGVTTATPPALTAAVAATVDGPFEVTFADSSAWRTNITGITINGTPLTAGFAVTAGTITFTPAASVPAALLQTAGEKSIVVQAASFNTTTVSQTLAAGAATQLDITIQPTPPSVNGAAFATQPTVTLRDQYGNTSSSTAPVTAAVGAETWALGGTTEIPAASGIAAFSGLTASSAVGVTGATIAFTSPGMSSATSAPFNLIAPPPANDNPVAAISLLPNSAAISGTFAGSTPITGSTLNDVWYSFVAVGPSASVTVNNIDPLGNKNLYVYSALPTTYSTTLNVVASGTATTVFGETASAANFIPGSTYYILVQDVAGTSGTFNIALTNTPAAPVTLPATDLTTTSFTANWQPVPGVISYRLDVYQPGNTSDLIFSEYVEGNSNNKYIEIHNGTASAVDLSDYEVRLFSNGASVAGSTVVLSNLAGGPTALPSGGTLVIRNSASTLTLPSGVVAYDSGVAGFNGDDALGLWKISTAAYVDIFGRIGSDPGAAWTSSSPSRSTLDQTLRRKSTVTTGVTTSPTGTGASAFTTLGTEWDQFNTDNVSGIGSHGPVLTYVAGYENLDVGSATSLPVTGLTPGTAYIYVVRAVAGNGTSGDSDSRNVTTIAVNVLPTFSGYSGTTGVDQPLVIAESAILANTADANGDTVTVSTAATTSTEGGSVSRSGGNLTYTPATGFTGSDTFTVTFSDGIGTINGVITVNVIGSDPLFTDPTLNAVLSDQIGGVKRLSFTGIPGRAYGIQRSSNLGGWIQINTVTAPPGGAVTFDDPSPLPDKGFYRIIFPAEPPP
jgi:hypothetical protein